MKRARDKPVLAVADSDSPHVSPGKKWDVPLETRKCTVVQVDMLVLPKTNMILSVRYFPN